MLKKFTNNILSKKFIDNATFAEIADCILNDYVIKL